MKLLILLALVACATALVTQVRLTHIESRRIKLLKKGLWRSHLRNKLLNRSLHKFHLKSIGVQNVNDYDDVEYVGNITIGSRKNQEFSVVLDTGSANLWIPDSTCKSLDCRSKHKFDSSKSRTYVKNGTEWSVSYGDGSNAHGFLGIDTMTFGGVNEQQLTVTKQTFGQATEMSGFTKDPVDGILGLGFTDLAVDDVVPPFINAINQKAVDKNMFTVWMAHRGNVRNVKGGVFTYGGYDTEHCGPEIATVPLTMSYYWQFLMDAVTVGSYSNKKGWEVISDTGTSFLLGPKNIIEHIALAIGGNIDHGNQQWTIDCGAKAANIVLTIGGHKYAIESSNYLINYGDNTCIIGIDAHDTSGWGPTWILGDTFIRQFCNMHYVTEKKIGFAKSYHY